MKRFYKEVTAEPGEGDVFFVALDGKSVRTPGRQPLRVPTRQMGEAIAVEWREQGDEIEPVLMPLTRLANSTVDRTAPNRAQVIEQVAAFGGADLLCYRAEGPADLVDRQSTEWQPVLDWLGTTHGATLNVTSGISPMAQSNDALLAIFTAVAAFDDFRLTGLHAVTAAAGSVALGLALAAGRIDAEQAWRAAHLDDLYQADRWGADADAESRREALRDEITAAAKFIVLTQSDG
ncbi:MAG: ATP12 family protein [Alphaproteobacteria bacterium]